MIRDPLCIHRIAGIGLGVYFRVTEKLAFSPSSLVVFKAENVSTTGGAGEE